MKYITIIESLQWSCENLDPGINRIRLMTLYCKAMERLLELHYPDAVVEVSWRDRCFSPKSAHNLGIETAGRIDQLRHEAWNEVMDVVDPQGAGLKDTLKIDMGNPGDLIPTKKLKKVWPR